MLRSFVRAARPKPRVVGAEQIELMIGGAPRAVLIRRSPNARRYTLRLKAQTRELVLTLPLRASMIGAGEFLRRHEGWIAARLARLPDKVRFEAGAVVPLRGAPHRIVHVPEKRGATTIAQDATGEMVLMVGGAAEHTERRVRDFLKKLARADLEQASHAYAAKLGVNLKRISIKDTSSRWGSCSAQGALSFSWRIVMAPPHVLDYLAAHEVAHRREMNHSARYWRLLRDLCPGTDAAERWLKAHGANLYRYG